MNGLEVAIANLGLEGGLLILGVTVTVLLVAGGLRAALAGRRDEVIDRLDRVAGRSDEDQDTDGGGARLVQKLARPFAWVTRPTRAAELGRLRQKMVQAGMRSEFALEVFLASKLVVAGVLTVGFLQLNSRLPRGLNFPMDMAVAVWLCGAAFLLPNLWLNGRVRKRQLMIERALPDAMDLLVTCVEAGLGLDAALSRVSEEIHLASPLLGSELQLTFLEIQAGVPRREAFRRLAERTGVEDLRQLSAVLTQTEMFGTSIARALRVHADGMRIKRMQRAEEKAAMVGVKMTIPLIFCILPSLMAVVLGPAVVSIFEKLIKGGR